MRNPTVRTKSGASLRILVGIIIWPVNIGHALSCPAEGKYSSNVNSLASGALPFGRCW